ncbi:hypothetical protein ABIC50_002680 [Burkholderia sp. 567]
MPAASRSDIQLPAVAVSPITKPYRFRFRPKVENYEAGCPRRRRPISSVHRPAIGKVPIGQAGDSRRLIHGSPSPDDKKSTCEWISAISHCREGKPRALPCVAQASVTAGNPGCEIERDGHSWVPYAGTYVPQTAISSHKFLRLSACEWVLTSLESLVGAGSLAEGGQISRVAWAEEAVSCACGALRTGFGSGLWGLCFSRGTRVFTSFVNNVYFFNYF